jgi:hypothetical protein
MQHLQQPPSTARLPRPAPPAWAPRATGLACTPLRAVAASHARLPTTSAPNRYTAPDTRSSAGAAGAAEAARRRAGGSRLHMVSA